VLEVTSGSVPHVSCSCTSQFASASIRPAKQPAEKGGNQKSVTHIEKTSKLHVHQNLKKYTMVHQLGSKLQVKLH
jgi:hypothetical protein